MAKTVIRFLGWSWRDIEGLYLDDTDFRGLEYWYDEAEKIAKEKQKK